MLSPFFKLDDDERDMLGKGRKSRVMDVTQWAGRKDSRALTHKSQIAWTMWGARMLLGKMGSAGQHGRTNVTNLCTVQFSSEGNSDSTSSTR